MDNITPPKTRVSAQQPTRPVQPAPASPGSRSLGQAPITRQPRPSQRPKPPVEITRSNMLPSPKPPQSKSSLSPFAIWGVALLLGLLGGIIPGAAGIDFGESSNSLNIGSSGDVVLSEEAEIVSQIAEKMKQSVVSITVESPSGSSFFGTEFTQESAGTGIVVSDDGYVLTNKHVIANASKVSVVSASGQVFDNVSVIGSDPLNDLAYVKIEGASGLTAATFGNSDNVVVGTKVVAIGNALGRFDNTVTTGIISGLSRPIVAGDGTDSESLQGLFQTDASINPGNSGGPLVNLSGEVIGINTAVADNAENIGFSIPINDTLGGLKSVLDSGKLERAYLGVRYVTLSPEISNDNDIRRDFGAWLRADNENSIIADSPADKAGLEVDDIILKINDDEINATSSLISLVSRYQVGETIELLIDRGGDEVKITVNLEAAPGSN